MKKYISLFVVAALMLSCNKNKLRKKGPNYEVSGNYLGLMHYTESHYYTQYNIDTSYYAAVLVEGFAKDSISVRFGELGKTLHYYYTGHDVQMGAEAVLVRCKPSADSFFLTYKTCRRSYQGGPYAHALSCTTYTFVGRR